MTFNKFWNFPKIYIKLPASVKLLFSWWKPIFKHRFFFPEYFFLLSIFTFWLQNSYFNLIRLAWARYKQTQFLASLKYFNTAGFYIVSTDKNIRIVIVYFKSGILCIRNRAKQLFPISFNKFFFCYPIQIFWHLLFYKAVFFQKFLDEFHLQIRWIKTYCRCVEILCIAYEYCILPAVAHVTFLKAFPFSVPSHFTVSYSSLDN